MKVNTNLLLSVAITLASASPLPTTETPGNVGCFCVESHSTTWVKYAYKELCDTIPGSTVYGGAYCVMPLSQYKSVFNSATCYSSIGNTPFGGPDRGSLDICFPDVGENNVWLEVSGQVSANVKLSFLKALKRRISASITETGPRKLDSWRRGWGGYRRGP